MHRSNDHVSVRARTRLSAMRCILAVIASVAFLSKAEAVSAQRRVHVSREKIGRMADPAVVSVGVAVLSARGVDRARIGAQGLQLEQRTFAAFRIADLLKEVPGPVAPTRSPETGPTTTPVDPGPLPRPAVREPFIALPFRYLTPDATATGTWVLRPVYKVANRLRWQPESRDFRGAIFLTWKTACGGARASHCPRRYASNCWVTPIEWIPNASS